MKAGWGFCEVDQSQVKEERGVENDELECLMFKKKKGVAERG